MIKLFIVFTTFTLGTSALAATYEYKCYSFYWNGYQNEKAVLSLTLKEDIAAADIDIVSWDDGLGGKLNPNYKSKGAVKFLKFGSQLILEESLMTGGTVLRDGSHGGIARVEGQAEGGFFQYKFICKR